MDTTLAKRAPVVVVTGASAGVGRAGGREVARTAPRLGPVPRGRVGLAAGGV